MRYGKAIFTSKNLQNCDEPHFHDKQDPKKNKSPHFFAPPRSLRSGGAKKWGLLFFFKKYKNRNNDFTTILDSENVNGMMPSTKFCSNLTDGVPGGSVAHTGSP